MGRASLGNAEQPKPTGAVLGNIERPKTPTREVWFLCTSCRNSSFGGSTFNNINTNPGMCVQCRSGVLGNVENNSEPVRSRFLQRSFQQLPHPEQKKKEKKVRSPVRRGCETHSTHVQPILAVLQRDPHTHTLLLRPDTEESPRID